MRPSRPRVEKLTAFITEDCIWCDVCTDECPLECISPPIPDYENYFIFMQKCDLCGGEIDDAKCVNVCPMDAIIVRSLIE